MTATSGAAPAVAVQPGGPGLPAALALAGAGAFLYGLWAGDPTRTWGIYLVNLLFWSSLAITGPALAAMMQVTEARWSPSAQRVALTTGGFLPVSLLLFLLLGLGFDDLYVWVGKPALVAKKQAWLNLPFFTLRTWVGVLVLYGLARAFTRSVFAEGEEGSGGQAARTRRSRLAAGLLFAYVLVLSLWGFDLLMSLDPVWYSGLFGGYYVVTSLYTGFGLVAFLVVRANARGLTAVSPAGVQDLAKLVFAMCIMWMYFFFSQYLVIWYGNVPVETRFFLSRFFVEPWRTLAWVIFVVGALIPFGYLLKRLTGRPPAGHTPLVVVIAMGWVAVFLERIVIVFPSISRANVLPLGPAELLITAGFLGLFLLGRQHLLARYAPLLRQAS